jgi:hypothetical protein
MLPDYGAVPRLEAGPGLWKILTSGQLFAIIRVKEKIAIAVMSAVDF